MECCVEYRLNEDVEELILQMLDVEDLFRCSTVCKRWWKLVASSRFRLRFMGQLSLRFNVDCKRDMLVFAPTRKKSPLISVYSFSRSKVIQMPYERVAPASTRILMAHDSLLLCCNAPGYSPEGAPLMTKFYIGNPATQEWVTIPAPLNVSGLRAMCSFRDHETGSIAFRIFIARWYLFDSRVGKWIHSNTGYTGVSRGNHVFIAGQSYVLIGEKKLINLDDPSADYPPPEPAEDEKFQGIVEIDGKVGLVWSKTVMKLNMKAHCWERTECSSLENGRGLRQLFPEVRVEEWSQPVVMSGSLLLFFNQKQRKKAALFDASSLQWERIDGFVRGLRCSRDWWLPGWANAGKGSYTRRPWCIRLDLAPIHCGYSRSKEQPRYRTGEPRFHE